MDTFIIVLLALGWVAFLWQVSRGWKKGQTKPVNATNFFGSVGPVKNKRKGQVMLEITITNEQQVAIPVAPKTAQGKPAEVQAGSVVVTVQSGDSTGSVRADGTVDLVSSDVPGVTLFLVEADADLGDGVETISDVVKLTVEGARAVNLGLVVGEVSAKPPFPSESTEAPSESTEAPGAPLAPEAFAAVNAR